jgi:transposase-like protein
MRGLKSSYHVSFTRNFYEALRFLVKVRRLCVSVVLITDGGLWYVDAVVRVGFIHVRVLV